MKNYLLLSFASIVIFHSCTTSESQVTKEKLTPAEFNDKIIQSPEISIVDVRTPDEYSKGHLLNANNIDWNGIDFDNQINHFDKNKPVMVYCLSGGRSASAAEKMRASGFKEVYELNGGIMKWREARLPEESSNKVKKSDGMSREQFDSLISINKLVLIDFYADWCAPCKKISPYLDEINKELSGKISIVRINSDENDALTKQLNVYGLPTLQLYKNKTLAWANTGYITKEELARQIK